MRWSPELDVLARQAARRSSKLRLLVQDLSPPVGSSEVRIVAYTTIEALNLWAEFERSYYISCCLGCRNRGGRPVTVTATIISVQDAIEFAVRTTRSSTKATGPWKRRDEPDWLSPEILLKLLRALNSSNLATAQAALSYPSRVFKDLPTVRNFFAHRHEETARKVASVAHSHGLSSRRRPEELMCTRLPSRPENILTDWLDAIRIVAVALCA